MATPEPSPMDDAWADAADVAADDLPDLDSEPASPMPESPEELLAPLFAPEAAPVAAAERVAAVDTLRGFALLGILAMNIAAFAWPFSAYDNPDLGVIGSVEANRASWLVSHLVFSGKMMSLFSMLFGAGLALMSGRADKRGASIRGVYYRRIGWLIVFGLIHGYLIWSGDILFAYGLCGLFLYPFRHKAPRTLIALGAGLILFSTLAMWGLGYGMAWFGGRAEALVARQQAGEALTEEEAKQVEGWAEMRGMFQPTPEQFAEEVATFRGGFREILPKRAAETAGFQFFYLPTIGFWGIGGRMLLGMGLMKLGVFAAARSRRFYVLLALAGYGVGLPLTIAGAAETWAKGFDMLATMAGGQVLSALGTVPVALGHAAVVMLVVQSGAIAWLRDRLAAVGRMALTNYLVQSLICTTIFYGYGLGYFGRLDRPALWLVVLSIWALQLWYSPIWLARFRYGPAEWLWRTLTYGRFQPIRNAA